MKPYQNQFVVWDAYPLHPHHSDEPFSIRNPNNIDVSQFGEAIRLIELNMKPETILSIGKKAFNELNRLDIRITYIRHPSRGGQKEFAEGILRFFLSKT